MQAIKAAFASRRRWAFLVLLTLLTAANASAETVLIAHEDVEVEALTPQDVRNIFLGHTTRWEGGARIALALQRKGQAHRDFLIRFINKNPRQYSTHWKKAVFTGSGVEPPSFLTDAAVVEFVRTTPGAIGYVQSGTSLGGCRPITVMN